MSKVDKIFFDGDTLWGSHLNLLVEAINDNDARLSRIEAKLGINGDETFYTLEISVSNVALGSVTGAGVYKAGEQVTVTATPNTGSKFTGWSDGVVLATRTVTMNRDITLYANFTADVVADQLSMQNDAVTNYLNGSKTMMASSNLLAAKKGNALPYPDIERTNWPKAVVVNGKSFYNLIPTTQILDGKSVQVTGKVRMIKMEGTDNFRDLGGWASSLGGSVKYGLLIRGAELTTSKTFTKSGDYYKYSGDSEDLLYYTNHTATAMDLTTLHNIGVGAELDLRGIDGTQYPSGNSPLGVDYQLYQSSLYSEADKNNYLDSSAPNMGTWRQMFLFILQHAEKGEASYFHCTWGADRTGALAMLLLGLLGVSEADIKRDYELTSLGNKAKGASDLDRLFWAINQMGEANLQRNFYKWWATVALAPFTNLNRFIKVMVGSDYDNSWMYDNPDKPSTITLSAGQLRSGCDGFIALQKANCRVSQDGSKTNDTVSGSDYDYNLLVKFDVSGYSKIQFMGVSSMVGACYDENDTAIADNGKFLYYVHDQMKPSNANDDTIVEVDVPRAGMSYKSSSGTTSLTKNTKYIAFNVCIKYKGCTQTPDQMYADWRVTLKK